MLTSLAREELLVVGGTDRHEPLSTSTVGDDTSLSERGSGSRREEGGVENGLQVVGGSGLGIGGSDGSVLETVELEVGLLEVRSDLSLKHVLEVLLEQT